MYPTAFIQDIKDRISIVALIGEGVPLKKAGRNVKGLCPFHQEKSPSFMVNEEKQIFHCFGCGEGGDVFHYVMKREGLSFPEAIAYLADRAGVSLPEPSEASAQGGSAQDKRRKLLLRVNELACHYFRERLQDPQSGGLVRNYLQSRGFGDDVFSTQHLLGAADDRWDGLVSFFQQRKVPMELAVQVGLVKPRPQRSGYYDFFRNRLIFPIRGRRGEVIAFGGRVVPAADGTAASGADAKYLNSCDSPLFHKGQSLYGLPDAGYAMRDTDRALVVEGYMDALALHQAGFPETVAPLGTALTEDHLRLITRHTRQLWILFDGDAAGRAAAHRALPLALGLGLIPRILVLPEGEDPDTFVRAQGREVVSQGLAAAPTLFEWAIDDLVASSGADTVGRVRAVQRLQPLFARLQDPIQESSYVERLAQAIRMPAAVVQQALHGSAESLGRRSVAPIRPAAPPRVGEGVALERTSLELLLQCPETMPQLAAAIRPEQFQDPGYRAVAEYCWGHYRQTGGVSLAVLLADADPGTAPLRKAISGLAISRGKYEDAAQFSQLAEELIAAWQRPQWRETEARLNAAIAAAEREGITDDVVQLIAEKQRFVATRHKGEAK